MSDFALCAKPNTLRVVPLRGTGFVHVWVLETICGPTVTVEAFLHAYVAGLPSRSSLCLPASGCAAPPWPARLVRRELRLDFRDSALYCTHKAVFHAQVGRLLRDMAQDARKMETRVDFCEVMARCEFLTRESQHRPLVAELFRNLYCRGNQEACARYAVLTALGRESVPIDLYPNEHHRAREITGESKLGL